MNRQYGFRFRLERSMPGDLWVQRNVKPKWPPLKNTRQIKF